MGDATTARERRTWAAIGATLAAALAITAVLGPLIAPSVRRAVRVAQAIAAGRLDNAIAVTGRGETADLLRALSTTQASIAAALARIRALMDEQASNHAGELAAGHARLEAALDNMNQGLCLFDADGRLAVSNRRFAEMFGPPEPGAHREEVPLGGDLDALLDATGGGAAGRRWR